MLLISSAYPITPDTFKSTWPNIIFGWIIKNLYQMQLSPNEQEMMYRWMQLVSTLPIMIDPGIKCKHLHCDTSCAYQVFYKVTRSIGKGFKFYIILHMIPFLLYKVKKINSWQKFKQEMFALVRKYVGSLLFMGSLVGGIKTFLCFSQKITKPDPTFKGKVFIWGSLLSSLSIYFEDSHRREQIVYFVFVRALRSAYIWAKKRKLAFLPYEQSSIFVFLFAALAYVFDTKKQLLKGQDLVEKLWGTA